MWNKPKQVFSYVRLSYPVKFLNSLAFEFQSDAVRQLCKSRGWEVAHEFRDSGFSPTAERFAEIFHLMERDRYDTIVVSDADRITSDVSVFDAVLNQARDAGIQIVIVEV